MSDVPNETPAVETRTFDVSDIEPAPTDIIAPNGLGDPIAVDPNTLPPPTNTPGTKHLFVVSMFSYRTTDMLADIQLAYTVAETADDAISDKEKINLQMHPIEEGWTGHVQAVSQCPDELVFAIAQQLIAPGPIGSMIPAALEPLTIPDAMPGMPKGYDFGEPLPHQTPPAAPPPLADTNPVVAYDANKVFGSTGVDSGQAT